MSDKIKLVRGDTGPQLIFSVTDSTTGSPIDFSTGTGATASVRFRPVGTTTIKVTMPCLPLPGIVLADGSVDSVTPPYNVAGTGGRLSMSWVATALDTSGEYEGELVITYVNGTQQTVYDMLKFTVREKFG